MFPGRNFSTPIFVDHGRDGSTDTRDGYVYAVSTDGFWDNGNYLTLGRVRRERLGNLRASDWEFVKDFALVRADPQDPRAWDSDHENAVPMPEVSVPRETSMTGIHYISALKTYLLPQWYHEEGNWFWKFFAGETPWGPWEPISFSGDSPYFDPSNPFRYCWRGGEDFYNPTIPTKFVDTSRTSLTILTAGTPGQDPYYHLYTVPATLAVVA